MHPWCFCECSALCVWPCLAEGWRDRGADSGVLLSYRVGTAACFKQLLANVQEALFRPSEYPCVAFRAVSYDARPLPAQVPPRRHSIAVAPLPGFDAPGLTLGPSSPLASTGYFSRPPPNHFVAGPILPPAAALMHESVSCERTIELTSQAVQLRRERDLTENEALSTLSLRAVDSEPRPSSLPTPSPLRRASHPRPSDLYQDHHLDMGPIPPLNPEQ